jgi:hypothetical protein
MVFEFEMNEQQLRLALDAIEKAKEKGFSHANAVLRITGMKEDGTDVSASFLGHIILKAHPEDPNQNWGRSTVEMLKYERCLDGKFVAESD